MLLFGRPACGLIHYVTLQKPMSSCVDKGGSRHLWYLQMWWHCRFLLHVGEVLLISLGKSETCTVANVYAPKSIAEKYSSSLSYSPSSLSAPSILILLIWGHSCCSLPLWTPSHPCLPPVYQCKKALLWNMAVNCSLTWLNRFCCNTMLWGLWWLYSFTPSLPPGFSWVAIWETKLLLQAGNGLTSTGNDGSMDMLGLLYNNVCTKVPGLLAI